MRTALAAAAMAAFFVPAAAQAAILACTEAETGHRVLSEKYGEQPVGRGVSRGQLVLLYSSRDGKSWTMARLDPGRGLMCIVAEGESWESVEFERPSESS